MIRSTFAIPAILAAASLFGLVAALNGDGMPDALAWITLATPLAAIAWAMRVKRT